MSDAPGPSRRAALPTLLVAFATPALAQNEAKRKAAEPRSDPAVRPNRAPAGGATTGAWQTLPPTPVLPQAGRSETATLGKTRLWFADYDAAKPAGAANGGGSGGTTARDEKSGASVAPMASGEPVLFLHGGYGHSAFWSHQIRALAQTRRVIATDTRGHGQSPVQPGMTFGFATFASDVDALLTHLGIEKVAIVGWSDGAITAMQLAMSKPERVSRMVLFGGNATPAGLIAGGSKLPPFASYVARCRADYARLSPTPEKWADLSAGLSAMWRREPNFPTAGLAKIKARTLVLAAEHDEIIRRDHAAFIAKTVPGANFVELKGVSHFAMVQNPAAFSGVLRDFLDA